MTQKREDFLSSYGVSFLLPLIALAIYAYSQQLTTGLGVTGLNRPVQWGIYIANFIFFIGLSAGGIAISALVHILNKEELKSVAIIAEVSAISSLLLATLFILFDLGRPDRIFYLFLNGNIRSPLIWDVTVISSYFTLCVALLFFSVRADLVKSLSGASPFRRRLVKIVTLGYTALSEKTLQRDRKLLRGLAFLSIPAFVALHSVTAWILGLVKGQPGWNTAILAPLFIISALVSGTALVILATAVSRSLCRVKVERKAILDLGKALFILVLILSYFLFSELLTIGYSGTLPHLAIFEELLKGKFATVFWFDVVFGITLPLFLLGFLWTRTRVMGVGIASVLVLVGVFTERIYILLPSLMKPYRGEITAIYNPTWVEWSIMAGTYIFGMLIFLAIVRSIFPAERRADQTVHPKDHLIMIQKKSLQGTFASE